MTATTGTKPAMPSYAKPAIPILRYFNGKVGAVCGKIGSLGCV